MENDKTLEELINQQKEDFSSVNQEEELEINEEEARKIIWQAKDFSIREFASMIQDGDLELQPQYQRKYVASPKIASKLIESILMDVPIPVIYLAEENDGSYSVIDGQQRLTSFISFMNEKYPNGDDFKLTGLKVLRELNRKQFSNIEKEYQNKIRKTTLHTIIIKKESNDDVKFEIFERLNTGSVKLNEDEIRNTVYRGKYINLLSELEENEIFHQLIKKDNFKNRMIYRGMILRFFALSEKSYLNYVPSMKQFCNKELRDNRNISDEKIKEYKNRFYDSLDMVKIVFGENSFRRYMPMNENEKGYWATSRINMALFDVQLCGFVNYSKNDVLRNADLIRESMLDLMINNEKFIQSILIQTSDRNVLKTRFKIWLDKLDEIIGDVNNFQSRAFSYQIKKNLFDKSPVCSISGQQILSIDDCEVDHIIPFSKGGKTDLSNAQLTLRYFNRAKNNNEEYK